MDEFGDIYFTYDPTDTSHNVLPIHGTKTPSSKQLASFGLHYGENTLKFY
jgi:hypothetical protein